MNCSTDLWTKLQNSNKPIVLYGTGNGADKIYTALSERGVKISGVFASDDFVRNNKKYKGFTICNYFQMKQNFGQMIVLVCFGSDRNNVLENIKKIMSEQETYAPDVPVYGKGLFTKEYAMAHKQELESVYKRLVDEKSRKVFQNIINYKLTGEIESLFNCETSRSECFEEILKLGKDEVYADLGAYNGDTLIEYINIVGTYSKIYAVEPDIKNFKKLSFNMKNYKDIELFNIAIGSEKSIINFSMNSGRNSSASKQEGETICCNSLDNIIIDNKVSYIKMDVEGYEIEAIKGAKNIIKNCKPKMQIACYHRNEDIFKIPLTVAQIRDDYKIYIRHNPCIPCWDTNFLFI